MSTEIEAKKPYVRPTIKRQFMGAANKFGGSYIPESMSMIEGIPIPDLVKEFGSPLFVFSENRIRRKIRELNRAFKSRYPEFQAAWSYKTNYLDAICKIFHDEGSWAEIVSSFEYQKTKKNGVPGNQVIFNGPYKPYDALKEAVSNGVRIHADHLDEIQDLLKIAEELNKTVEIAIRINLVSGAGADWDRFGFNLESGQALQAVRKISSSQGKLKLIGLHTHLGTFMLETTPYKKAIQKLSQFWKQVRNDFNQPLQYLDLGGGFASNNKLKAHYLANASTIPSFDSYAETICDTLFEEFAPENPPSLFLETGRALVDDSGFLISSVVATKSLGNGRRGYVMDAGVNLLYTTTWYDLQVSPVTNSMGPYEEVSLFGPLCMNIDKVRDSVLLPNLQRFDQVVLHPVGAYNVTQWMQFIEMRPAIVLIDSQGKPKLIRKRETVETLEQEEIS